MKKIIEIAILLILSVSLVSANTDVGVTSGQTVESDFLELNEQDHETLGGVVSSITSEFRRWVKYLGMNVYQEETITDIQNFQLFAFPVDTNVDFVTVSIGNSYAISEPDIDVRGITGTWETFEAETDFTVETDNPTLDNLNDIMTYSDGKTLQITFRDGGTHIINYNWNDGTNSGSDSTQFIACDSRCPSDADLISKFGLSGVVAKLIIEIPELDNALVVTLTDGVNPWQYVIDKVSDGIYNFNAPYSSVIGGYEVDSTSGQALAIIPQGIYDLYGVY